MNQPKSTDPGVVLREIQETLVANSFYSSQGRTASNLERVEKRLKSLEASIVAASAASSQLAKSLNFLTRVGVAVALADFFVRLFFNR